MNLAKKIAFIILTYILSTSCDPPIPADMVFCKAEELLVLEEAFNEKSAIIIMYKGDDLRLLGDTAYALLVDSEVLIDSSVFYVKVRAKRGVIGWVDAQKLQHERPKIAEKKPKPAIPIEKKPEPVSDSIAPDSLATNTLLSDSLKSVWVGNYSIKNDSVSIYMAINAIDSINRVHFDLDIDAPCQLNYKSKAVVMKGREVVYELKDIKLHFLFAAPFLELKLTNDAENRPENCSSIHVQLRKK